MSDQATAPVGRSDGTVEEFRASWRRRETPDLREYLGRLDPADAAGRLDLLRADQHFRWLDGDRKPAEGYVACLPDDAVEDALVLVWAEVRLRRAAGERPADDEYARRFPRWADHIGRLFELESAIDGVLGSTVSLTPEGSTETSGLAAFAPDGYELIGEVGRGAMGVVYKARQAALDRVVAVKVLRTGPWAPVDLTERSRREAALAARLQHPNIVQVFGFGVAGGNPFIAMEYVDGQNLAQSAGALPQPPREAARLVETLAAAAHHAHLNGVVHWDLKPSNVLVCRSGVLKIADFGLARPTDATHTATGGIIGTPAYMAPEQARGDGTKPSPAADVYGLGAILYDLLTGRPPFRADTPLATVHKVLHDEPTPPSRLQPGIPRDVETICLKCLEKDPRKRYATAAALAEDLRRFQAGESIAARPVRARERAWRWTRRNPGWAAAIVLLALAAVGATAAAFEFRNRERRAVKAEGEVTQKVVELREERRKQTEELLKSYTATARAKRVSGQVGRRFEALEAVGKAAELARELNKPPETFRELRGEAVASLALPDVKLEREWSLPNVSAYQTAWSPDLSRYVTFHPEGGLAVYDAGSPTPVRRLAGEPAATPWPAIGPGGRYLIAGLNVSPPTVGLWDLHDARPDPKLTLPGEVPVGAPFRPDGREFALRENGKLVFYDPATGTEVGRRDGLFAIRSVAYDPAGRRVAVVHDVFGAGSVLVLDVATRDAIHTWPGEKAYLETPAWSDDGRLLAVGWGRAIRVFEHADGPPRLVSVLDGSGSVAIRPSFVPGTGLLASSSWDGVTRLWDPISGRQAVQFPGDLMRVSADGSRLVTSNERTHQMQLWRIDPAAECRLLYHGRVGNRSPDPWNACSAFDPTGRVLATGGRGEARFWDAARGAELGPVLPFPVESSGNMLFLPGDGSLVTHGKFGCVLWPRQGSDGQWRFGPPRPLTGAGIRQGATVVTPDGQWLAHAESEYPIVRHTADPTRRNVLAPHRGLNVVALSPDARWVATGTWQGRDAVVWEVASSRVVHRIRGTAFQVCFSPDGQRLATWEFRAELRLWDTDGWRQVAARREWAGPIAFSPDSRLLAVGSNPRLVQLLDPRDGSPVVALEASHPAGVHHLAFDPTGRKLAVGTADQCVHLWDLALVRRQLAEMGLDWEDSPPPPTVASLSPPAITVLGADLATDRGKLWATELDRLALELWLNPFDAGSHFERGRLLVRVGNDEAAYRHFTAALALRPDRPAIRRERCLVAYRTGRWAEAAADADRAVDHLAPDPVFHAWRGFALAAVGRTTGAVAAVNRAVELAPDDASTQNLAAWLLVTGPPALRDPGRAVKLARDATNWHKTEPVYWNTLGVALYRAGRYAEAVTALEESRRLSGEANVAYDLFFLALCHHKLGRPDEAKKAYRDAVAWVEAHPKLSPPDRADLAAFRAEAEEALGRE
jgi:WD40 repeat protein/lipoprotein NlpI/predicted Ser/Thr protein kinase